MLKNNKKSYKFGRFNMAISDSGRGMIEMLGVLAIIGVLTIGCIFGYKYAMTKYQVNQIANEVNLLSNQIFHIMHSNDKAEEEYELLLGEPHDSGHLNSASYELDFGCGVHPTTEIEPHCADIDHYYFISLENVPSHIATPLLQMVALIPGFVRAENSENLLGFVFSRDGRGLKVLKRIRGTKQM